MDTCHYAGYDNSGQLEDQTLATSSTVNDQQLPPRNRFINQFMHGAFLCRLKARRSPNACSSMTNVIHRRCIGGERWDGGRRIGIVINAIQILKLHHLLPSLCSDCGGLCESRMNHSCVMDGEAGQPFNTRPRELGEPIWLLVWPHW